jgi:hypothetical protein
MNLNYPGTFCLGRSLNHEHDPVMARTASRYRGLARLIRLVAASNPALRTSLPPELDDPRACAAVGAGRKPAQLGTALGLRVADKCHRAHIIYRAAAIDAKVLFYNIVDR